MAYGLIYTFSFQDQIYESPAMFRIDIEKKNYVGTYNVLPFLSDAPAILERYSDNEDKLTSIIGTKLTLGVVYDGISEVPHPSIFKNIQEDEYRVNVYKNNVINFRGFIKPDATSYPFTDPPFSYGINATDYFNGMKSKQIDLNVSGNFYYGPISFADFIGRTVFNAVDYTDAIINVLFRIQPQSMNPAKSVLGGIFVHTDSFYSSEDGPMSIYNALQQFLKSFRARIFFSAGTYWLQRISDIYFPYTDVIQYVYPLTIDENFEIDKSHANYKDDFYILEDTGNISVSPAIYSQKVNYRLKGLNQIRNFAWLEFNPPRDVVEWEVFSSFNLERVGLGSAGNPFRLRIFEPSSGPSNMQQEIGNIQVGQRIQLQLKLVGNYAKDIGIGVLLGSTTDPGNAYALDSGGNWVHLIEGSVNNLLFPVTIPKSGQAELDITSMPIPEYTPNFPVTVYVSYPRPIDGGAPPGEQTWVDIYPIFLRFFTSSVTDMESTTINDKVFSYIPDKDNLFYLDTDDALLSNTVYTDTGTEIVPIPLNDWMDDGLPQDKTLDYLAGQTILDNFNESSNVLEGDIRSNTLEFYQAIKVPQIDSGVTLLQIGDVYDMQKGIHKITAHQIFAKSYGDGTYTIKSIINS